jgi:hypothetical protein
MALFYVEKSLCRLATPIPNLGKARAEVKHHSPIWGKPVQRCNTIPQLGEDSCSDATPYFRFEMS